MDDDLTWHAVESKKQFDEIVQVMIRLTGQSSSAASFEDREALARAENEVEFDAYELSEVLSKFADPTDRGDAFIFATRLIEVAFTIGQINRSEEATKAARHLLSKKGGDSRGEQIKEEADRAWREAFKQRFVELRKTRHFESTTKLCEEAYQGKPSSFDNARRYILKLERANEIPRKQKRS